MPVMDFMKYSLEPLGLVVVPHVVEDALLSMNALNNLSILVRYKLCPSLLEQSFGNDHLHDLIRSLQNTMHPAIPPPLLHWVVLEVAVSTIQLHDFIANTE